MSTELDAHVSVSAGSKEDVTFQKTNMEEQRAIAIADDNENSDDLYDDDEDEPEEDENLDFETLSLTNPHDLTKSYNRQLRLNDPSIPSDQKPKTNPQKFREGRMNSLQDDRRTGARKPKANTRLSIDDQIQSLSRHAGKLKLDSFYLKRNADERDKDKSDRATVEQVLDPRTRMILLKLVNKNIVTEMHGCIATGKEANVYHAIHIRDAENANNPKESSTPLPSPTLPVLTSTKPTHLAIKIYKTSILVFKDRDKYVTGEFRFRQGYNKHNNRAMVKLWAEKEMRNLKRIHAAGIPCPEPVHLRQHVLVIKFVGDSNGKDNDNNDNDNNNNLDGDKAWPAPRLRDVNLDDNGDADPSWSSLYIQLLSYMRILYHVCKLVHADLSEYNVLYSGRKLWIIDVSQSVEHDHPRSLEFLRLDIKNVKDFFARKGVLGLSERSIFAFVTAEKGSLDMEGMRVALEKMCAVREDAELEGERGGEREDMGDGVGGESKESIEDSVFRQQYIPQNLQQVYDIERDAEYVGKEGPEALVYQSLLARKDAGEDDKGEREVEKEEDGAVSDEEDEGAPLDYSPESADEEGKHMKGMGPETRPRGRRFEDKDSKKVSWRHT